MRKLWRSFKDVDSYEDGTKREAIIQRNSSLEHQVLLQETSY